MVLQTEVIAIRDQLEALYHSQRCKSDRCGTCSVNVCTDAELDRTVCSTDFGTPPRCKAQTGQFLSETQTSVKVRAGRSAAHTTCQRLCRLRAVQVAC